MALLACFLVIIAAFGYIHYQLVYVQAESIVRAFQATILTGPAMTEDNKTGTVVKADSPACRMVKETGFSG